jgi:hypothetical protein
MPADTPVTIPAPPAVATTPVAELHTPPVDVSLNVAVAPAHILAVPVIPAGIALTVSIVVTVQPLPNE